MLEDENTLYMFTDGSSLPHPRKGGVGIVFKYTDEYGKEQFYELDPSGYQGATNNQMEIKACTLGLVEARKNPILSRCKNLIISSDSQYVIDNYKRAEYGSQNKWTLQSGAPVANVPYWKEFLHAKKKLRKPVEIKKVKAHAKNALNNRADKLAKRSAKFPLNKGLQVVHVTRKISIQPTIKGSVKIMGQTMWIHIIGRKYLHENDTHEYRYEVMSAESDFFECVDFIFSKTYMKRNHIYSVRVNSDQNFPQVEEIFDVVRRRDWRTS